MGLDPSLKQAKRPVTFGIGHVLPTGVWWKAVGGTSMSRILTAHRPQNPLTEDGDRGRRAASRGPVSRRACTSRLLSLAETERSSTSKSSGIFVSLRIPPETVVETIHGLTFYGSDPASANQHGMPRERPTHDGSAWISLLFSCRCPQAWNKYTYGPSTWSHPLFECSLPVCLGVSIRGRSSGSGILSVKPTG